MKENYNLTPEEMFSYLVSELKHCTYEECLSKLRGRSAFCSTTRAELREITGLSVEDGSDGMFEACGFLKALYAPDDCIFIGYEADSKNHAAVKTRDNWIKALILNEVEYPLICLNPVTLDGAVEIYAPGKIVQLVKCCLPKNIELRTQAAFWYGMICQDYPVRSLVYDGYKSIHGIFQVNLAELVSNKIFALFDKQPMREARMTRLPGFYDNITGKFQSLLFLSGWEWKNR